MRRFVVLGCAIFVAAAIAVGGILAASSHRTSMPGKYRYTGWMQVAGLPMHIIVEGDAGELRFADRWNLTKTPVAYRVCVARVGAAGRHCAVATAPASSRPSSVPMGLALARCPGDFRSRWYVAGRVVATWPFRYICETPTP